MSTANPSNFLEWFRNLPIPWLVGGPNGQKEATSNGTVFDGEVTNLKDAAKVAFPGLTPPDGVPHVGNDRVLIQGPSELNQTFRIRLRYAWDDHERRGTWLELLVQLYWIGWPDAVIVQQNGLGYSLSGAPQAGVDPTGLLTITSLGTTTVGVGAVPPATKTIPAGTEWWTFDDNADLASRFAILFPSGAPSSAADITRMQTTVKRWRPAKAVCVGVYVIDTGYLIGYPVRLINSGFNAGANIGPSSSTIYLGA